MLYLLTNEPLDGIFEKSLEISYVNPLVIYLRIYSVGEKKPLFGELKLSIPNCWNFDKSFSVSFKLKVWLSNSSDIFFWNIWGLLSELA